jgi:hypothetical protein
MPWTTVSDCGHLLPRSGTVAAENSTGSEHGFNKAGCD